MPRTTPPLAAAIAVVGALALSACSPTAETPTSTDSAGGGDTDRTLVVYSGRDEELVGPLIDQFAEASGITVDVRYAGSTELAAQLLEEGDQTPAQVFLSQESGALGALDAAGLLATLPTDITSAVPAEYTSSDDSWVGLTGRARVVAYDSEQYTADEVPGDLFELIEPQWQGQIGIVPGNASFQAFVTALRVNEGEDRAREWLEGIAANDPQIFARNGELLEAVNTGVVPIGLINHYYWSRSEQDPTTLRAQLKFGDPGTISALVNVTGAGILTGSADSPEALEFVEFLVSADAQTYFAEETYEYPLAGDLAGPDGLPTLAGLGGPDIDLSDLSSVQETVAMITDVGLL